MMTWPSIESSSLISSDMSTFRHPASAVASAATPSTWSTPVRFMGVRVARSTARWCVIGQRSGLGRATGRRLGRHAVDSIVCWEGRLESDITRVRMRAQRLMPGTAAASPVDVVRHLVGLHAQIPSAVALVIRARTSGACIGDVDRVRDNGSIVRTWLMRRTLHLVAADDLDWLLAVLAPTLLARAGRRYGQLGLDDGTLSRSVDVLIDMLGDGPLTRAQMFDRLAAAGIDPSGQRGIHIVQHA